MCSAIAQYLFREPTTHRRSSHSHSHSATAQSAAPLSAQGHGSSLPRYTPTNSAGAGAGDKKEPPIDPAAGMKAVASSTRQNADRANVCGVVSWFVVQSTITSPPLRCRTFWTCTFGRCRQCSSNSQSSSAFKYVCGSAVVGHKMGCDDVN